ncbi:PAS domain S-box-containing protein [Azospirillum sp. OGB3]|uniref:PAS domain-containing protein n=1 Tax=Azospirillum sp. OGB3 TaxID=2587012 RepID=UPI001606ABB4|nr:PAS domain-containing protein [Azospirillum sp. OGB3]MBB3268757.1 PAS domain S-box-containing protein [Azospirillum sp. OGB3]
MLTSLQKRAPRKKANRLLSFLLLIAAPLLAFELFPIMQLHAAREAELRQDASHFLDLVDAEQRRVIQDIHHILFALTEAGVGRMDATACQEVMSRIRAKYPSYMAMEISDANGTVWCSTDSMTVGRVIAGRLLQDAASTDGIVTGQSMRSPITGQPAIPFARAHRREDGDYHGVIAALLDTAWLRESLTQDSLPDNTCLLVADRDGTVLATIPDAPELAGRLLPEPFGPLLREATKGVVELAGMDGRPRVFAYSPATSGARGLYLHVGLDKATAMRPIHTATFWTVAVFLGLLLATGLGALWGVRRFLRVREEAQHSARKVSVLLANTVDGVIEFDRDWRFLELNDMARTLVAQGRDLLGMRLWDAFPELAEGQLADELRRAMTERVPVDVEFRGPQTGRWFWLRAFPTPRGLTVHLLDISRRTMAEEELRASNERLSLALQSAQAGSFDWDLRTGRGHWSEGSYRLFGLDPESDAPCLESWLRTVKPDDVETITAAAQAQLFGERKPYLALEYRIMLPDGTVRWVLSTGRVHYDTDGTPLRMSGLNIDITERKSVEAALQRSERNLAIALNAANAGLWDLDLRTGVVTWSDGMYRLLGVDPTTFHPSEPAFYNLVVADDHPALRQAVQDVLEGRRPDYQAEFRISHPRKGVCWLLGVGRAEHDGSGRPVRLSGMNMDVSERRAMEQALRDAKTLADEANQSKSRFLAATSHDLRQPLQSALLFAGVLQSHALEDRSRRSLVALERALDTLKALLDSLLDVSRLDVGTIVPQVRDMPVASLLDEMRAAYSPIAASKGLELHVTDPGPTLAVRSDPVLLGRIVRNLVENALRYTPEGYVRVVCDIAPDRVSIQVHDSGIGISAEQVGRVFEEFHQVNNPERDRSQGLGLGLAIVQRLSQLLDHPVTVRSEPGRGSTFAVDVPLAGAAGTSPSRPKPVVTADGQRRLAVLIDDDVIVLSGLRTLFMEWGYEVVIAGSAAQALEGLRDMPRAPDLVVADYRLRGGEVGTDAVASIRAQAGHPIPGIILTGDMGSASERDATDLGVTFLRKPVASNQLLAVVQELLGS